MQVIEKDDRLIIRTRWLAGCIPLVFGLVFALVGLGAFWWGGRSAALTCTRLEAAEVRCQITQALLGITVRRIDVTNPRQALVEEHEDSDGETTYRVALVTTSGSVPVNERYTGSGVRDLADQINRFLSTPTSPALTLDQPPTAWIFVFPVCFTGFGVLLMFGIQFNSYTFDRGRDTLTIQRESLGGTRRQELPLTGLTVAVREDRDSDGDVTYCVHLQSATGGSHAVGHATSSRAAEQKLADRITEFVKPGARIRYIDVKD